MDKANQKDVPYYLKTKFENFVMPKEVNLNNAKTVECLIGSRSSSLLENRNSSNSLSRLLLFQAAHEKKVHRFLWR